MLTGVDGASMSMSGASGFNLQFADHNQFVEIKQDATITNMDITGYSDDSLTISGGTTTIANGNFTENLGVALIVGSGATLWDMSKCTLNMTSSDLVITVNGTMQMFGGPNGGIKLIADNGNRNNYIDVNGGSLTYSGSQGILDTIEIPVYVENGGTFNDSNDPGLQAGGILHVEDASNYIFPNGSKESVYMTGSSSTVQLSTGPAAVTGPTLSAMDGYYQDGGALETLNTAGYSLIAEANGGTQLGTATIAGGMVIVDNIANSYGGELEVYAKQVNFDGELVVSIQGYNFDVTNPQPGKSGQFSVTGIGGGNLNLQASSSLLVKNDGKLQKLDYWIIITAATLRGDFDTESTQPQTLLTYAPNAPQPGLYEVTFNA